MGEFDKWAGGGTLSAFRCESGCGEGAIWEVEEVQGEGELVVA